MEWWQLNGPWLIALLVAVFGLWESRRARRQGWQGERSSASSVPLAQYQDAVADYIDLLAHDVKHTGLLREYAPQVSVEPLPRRRDGRGLDNVQGHKLREYRKVLYDRLSEDEIRNAAFDLSLDLNGSIGRGTLLRKLIEYLEDRGQEAGLFTWLARNRPDIKLE